MTIPFGPIKALKAAAITTVGKINGTEKSDLRNFFPGNLYLENIQARESPNNIVRIIESSACQVVNPNTLPIFAQLMVRFPAYSVITLSKIVNKGKKYSNRKKIHGTRSNKVPCIILLTLF